MVISNATVIAPTGMQQADIVIEGEQFVSIERHSRMNYLSTSSGGSQDVVDASGLLAFPGLIDVHTHMRQPGGEHKEDFYTGTCAALAGGITSILAMPNTSPALVNRATLDMALDLAGQNAVCDFGLFLGASSSNQRLKLEDPSLRECGLKMYMGSSTGDLLVEDFGAQYEHFLWYPHERVIAVHAEHEPAVRYFGARGERRPVIAAEVEVARAVAMAGKVGRRVHICHVSSQREVEIISDAKRRGVPLTFEFAPHYLYLTHEYETGASHAPYALQPGSLYQMNPPLREKTDVETLWAHLDVADCIATDHAPHTLEEKYGLAPPSGVPGLETMLPLLLTAAHERRLMLPEVARLCCEGPATTYGIRKKGRIAPGFDADLTLVDPNDEWVIGERPLYTKCGWSPYAGQHVRGAVKQVYVRGRLSFVDGKVVAPRGTGRRIVN